MAKRMPPVWIILKGPKRIAWPGTITSEVPQGPQPTPNQPPEE